MKSFKEFCEKYDFLNENEKIEWYNVYKEGFKDAVIEFHNIKEKYDFTERGLEEADTVFQYYYSDIVWMVF